MDFKSQLFSSLGESGKNVDNQNEDNGNTDEMEASGRSAGKTNVNQLVGNCDESVEEILGQPQQRSSLRHRRRRQSSIVVEAAVEGSAKNMLFLSNRLNSKRKVIKDLDEEDYMDSTTIQSSSTVLNQESLKVIEGSTKAIVKEEFEKHYSMNAMFQLHSDTYSFLLTCKFQSLMFVIAVVVFCLQMALYGLAFASATDFSSNSNPLQVPAGVEVSVTAAQFLALGVAVIVQDSLRESLFLMENYRVVLDDIPGNTQAKLLICFAMKLSESVLSLVLILVLICQKDDVIELLMDVAALLFVSSFDNVVFHIGQEGYLGKRVGSAIDTIRRIRFHTSGRKRLKIILRTTVMMAVYFSLLVSWIIICPVRQGNGYYLPDQVLVQFPGGSSDASLSFFTGVYKLDKKRVFDRRIMYVESSKASRFYDTQAVHKNRRIMYVESGKARRFDDPEAHGSGVHQQRPGVSSLGRFPAYFAYCTGLTAFVFVAAGAYKNGSPCSDYQAVSSRYEGYNLLETADKPWHINNNAKEPIKDFFLRELSSRSSSSTDGNTLYGLREEFDPPCPNLQVDELKGQLVSTRHFAPTYEILKHSDDRAVEVYTRPVYINKDSSDIIFYTGSAWVLTGMSFMHDFANGGNLTTYFADEFHAYWSNYDSFLVTENTRFSSEKDAATPVGLNWFVFNQETQEADFTQPVDAILLCTVCNEAKNPCFYQGECTGNGSCRCTTGSTGVLCQVPPVSDGKCDSFFNSLAFNWDGGDCCKSTCKSKGKQNCGRDSSRNFPLGFVQCHNPDVYKCSTASSNNLCWVTGGESLFGESNNAESGYVVAATESVLVVGEPGASSVRVFDRFGSEFFFRDALPSLPVESRFGTSVSVASHKNIFASATKLTKPIVAATSSKGELKVFDWSYDGGVWLDISPGFVAWEDGDPQLLSVQLHKDGSVVSAFESDSLRQTGRVTIWEHDRTSGWVQKANITCHCSDFSLSDDAGILVAAHSNESLAALHIFSEAMGIYGEHSFVHLHGPAKAIKLSATGAAMATLGLTDGDINKKELCLFDRSKSNSTLYPPRSDSCYRLHHMSDKLKDSIEMNEDGSFISLVIKERRSITSFSMVNGLWRNFDETIHGFSAVLFGDSELIVGRPFDDSAGSNRGSVAVFAREQTFCQKDEVLVDMFIHFDAFPEETWFQVLDQDTKSTVMQQGPFMSVDAFLTSKHSICVKQDQCLSLHLYDTKGNGIASPGHYSLHIDGSVLSHHEFTGGLLDIVTVSPRKNCLPSLFDSPAFLSAELLQRCGNRTCDWLQSGGDITGNSNNDMLGMVTCLSSGGQVVLASAKEAVQGSASRGSVDAFMQVGGKEWEQIGNTFIGSSSTASLGAVMDAASRADAFVVLSDDRSGLVYHLKNSSWLQKGDPISSNRFWDVSISSDGNTVAFVDTNEADMIDTDAAAAFWRVWVHIYVWDGFSAEWNHMATIGNSSHIRHGYNGEGCEPVSKGFVLAGSGKAFAVSCWQGHFVFAYAYDENQHYFRQMGPALLDKNLPYSMVKSHTERVGRPVSMSSDGRTLATSFTNHYTKVWMYHNGSWIQKGKTIWIGGEVSLGANGNIIAIGSPAGSTGSQGTSEGVVHVLHFFEPIGSWAELGKEKIGELGGRLGSSVSLTVNGLRLAAGEVHYEPTPGSPKVGRVLVFDFLPTLSPGSEKSCGVGLIPLEVQITTDEFPQDNSYDILDFRAELLVSSSLESAVPNERITHRHCVDLTLLPRFNMHDSYGNGLCCKYGRGSFKLLLYDKVIHEGGRFQSIDSVCLDPNTSLVDIRLLTDWSDSRTESLTVLHSNGSTVELWSKKGTVGEVHHQSCSTAACLVYTTSAKYDSRFLTGNFFEVSFNQTLLKTKKMNGFAYDGSAEGVENFLWFSDIHWFGQCQESLCPGNQSIFQISLREDCYYRTASTRVRQESQCSCSSSVQTSSWRLSTFYGSLVWGMNSSTPLPNSHYWACTPLRECLTFTWDNGVVGADHSQREKYLQYQDATFSLWYDEERFVNMNNDRLRFPKVYQHGNCFAKQCGEGYALFHLHATTGQNPTTVWSIHGSDSAAIVTHGFTKSDSNSTYDYRVCFPVAGSYVFVSVLGTDAALEASWDGKTLNLKDGGAHFGKLTGKCEHGMLHLTSSIWFPRSILFDECGVVCDDGYSLLDVKSVAGANLTSLSWSIFQGSNEKAIWTQQIPTGADNAEFERLFCLPDEESYFLFFSGGTMEHTSSWDGLPIKMIYVGERNQSLDSFGFASFGKSGGCDNRWAPFDIFFQIKRRPTFPAAILKWELQHAHGKNQKKHSGYDWCDLTEVHHHRLCYPIHVWVSLWWFYEGYEILPPGGKYIKTAGPGPPGGPQGVVLISYGNETILRDASYSFVERFFGDQCYDGSGWFDSDGHNCEWYSEGNRCTQGISHAGITANQACCICGGGSFSSWCYDEPEWYDSIGHDCDWYSQFGCEDTGHTFQKFGKTANEACCTCGGGLPCFDEPEWYDRDGLEYNCTWYSEGDNCAEEGHFYENFGKTANEACCVCGGGLHVAAGSTCRETQCEETKAKGWGKKKR